MLLSNSYILTDYFQQHLHTCKLMTIVNYPIIDFVSASSSGFVVTSAEKLKDIIRYIILYV